MKKFGQKNKNYFFNNNNNNIFFNGNNNIFDNNNNNNEIFIFDDDCFYEHFLLKNLKKTNEFKTNKNKNKNKNKKNNNNNNNNNNKNFFRLSELENNNLYFILNCEENSTLDEIKKNYKKLIHLNHPDKGGKTEEFLKIQNAFKILNFPLTKKIFDKFGTKSLPIINEILLLNQNENFSNVEEIIKAVDNNDLESINYLIHCNFN